MARYQSETVRELIKRCKDANKKAGVTVVKLEEFKGGHFRLTGNTVVDYWPDSKQSTAFTKEKGKFKYIYPSLALTMALQGEPKPAAAPKRVQPEEVCRDPLSSVPFPELQEMAREMMKKHNINPKR